jgi:hypothetical protein
VGGVSRDAKAIPQGMAMLLTMLTYRRPAGSETEMEFIKRFLVPLGTLPDEYGNHWLTIGKAPEVLFSSHTDTVHDKSGMQKVLYGDCIASVGRGSNCLGADCTTGVWLMMEMIRARVSGVYVFHRDEEVGGLGSAYIRDQAPERLQGIRYAIAFDRKGWTDIITHQAGGRCASDAFAASLAGVLGPRLGYVASDQGTFTDTANYAELIPECTNISVGYNKQHQKLEWQDMTFALRLRDALVDADWGKLVCERDPMEDWKRDLSGAWVYQPEDDLERFVRRRAADVAIYLADHGISVDDIETYVWGG